MRISLMMYSLVLNLSLPILVVCNGCSPSTHPATISGTQTIALTVGSGHGKVGGNISIPVTMDNSSIARAVSCTINYDSAIVTPGDNGSGSIRDNNAKVGSGIASRRKWSNGSVTLSMVYGNYAQTSTVATIPFKVVGSGSTNVTVTDVTAYDDNMQPVSVMTKKTNGKLTAVK